jgi:ADP-heptose:LPS heptosyltransferase
LKLLAAAIRPPPGMAVVSLRDEIGDFEDTAAILGIADLLVSVDSSPVHLAGALGHPVWVILPFMPDWRWRLARSDTPYYAGMCLFRQPSRGHWGSVMGPMAPELGRLAA